MADKAHVVTERIQYEVKGVQDVVKGVKAVEDALHKLEGKGISLGPEDKKTLDTIRKLTEETEKSGKASGKTADIYEQTFGKGMLANMSKFGVQLQVIKQGFYWIVDTLDFLTSALMKADKGSMALAASGGKVLEGWGWTSEGKVDLGRFAHDLGEIGMGLGLTADKGREIATQFVQSGGNFRQLSGEMKTAATSAVDNAFLLYGSIDRLGDVIKEQATMMDNFQLSTIEGDKALKGIAIDAHAAGMATERFLGTVRDISGEMDLYGGHLKETSKLLSLVAKHAGDARAIKDTQTLTSTLKGLTVEQRVFFMTARQNLGKVSGVLEEDIADLRSRAAEAADLAKAARGRGGKMDIEYAEGQERRSRSLGARATTMEGYQKALGGGAGPVTQAAVFGALDPVRQLKLMLSSIPGATNEKGEVSLANAAENLESIVPKIAALTGKSMLEAIDFVRILQDMQGNAASLDEVLGKNAESSEVLKKLMGDSQEGRVKELVESFRGWREWIEVELSNFSTRFFEQFRPLFEGVAATVAIREMISEYLKRLATLDKSWSGLKSVGGSVLKSVTGQEGGVGDSLSGYVMDQYRLSGKGAELAPGVGDLQENRRRQEAEQARRDEAHRREVEKYNREMETAERLERAAKLQERAAQHLNDAATGRTVEHNK